MRYAMLAAAILLGPALSIQAHAQTQMGISISNRGFSIGFVMSSYPTLVRIPGYPVYYDPSVYSNYFFYDGLYWVFQDDNWYSSAWYNGPWDMVPPAYVPLFILRIPVRYYRRPPVYFRGWRADDPPRWGEHWGPNWERERSGWNHWNRRDAPRPAPLPTYQRNYTGDRYPRLLDEQRAIEARRYRYQPRDPVSRQIFEQRRQRQEFRDRQPQQQNIRQQEMYRQQQQQNVRQQEMYRQQQQQNVRQQEMYRQQQQQNMRQQEMNRQQQQQNMRQQEMYRQRTQQDARQPERARQQQQQNNRQRQPQRSRPARSGSSGGMDNGT